MTVPQNARAQYDGRGGETDAGQALTDAWTAIDWADYQRDVLVNRRRIHYVDIGSGPPVLLVHGLGGCWQWWLKNLPGLATHARVIAVDLAGFGDSERAIADDAYAGQVDMLAGLLDVLGIECAIVVGHSMGGLVAVKMAAEYPDRVRGLALVSAGGAPLGSVHLTLLTTAFRLFAAVFSIPGLPAAIARHRRLRRGFLSAGFSDPASVPPQMAVEILPRMRAPGFMPAVKGAARGLSGTNPADVRCPCQLVWGAKDPVLPLSVAFDLVATLPDARLCIFDDVAHCAMIEAPERFNRVLIDFVKDPCEGRAESGDGVSGAAATPGRRWWWIPERIRSVFRRGERSVCRRREHRRFRGDLRLVRRPE